MTQLLMARPIHQIGVYGLAGLNTPLEMVSRALNDAKGITQIGIEVEKGTRPDKGVVFNNATSQALC